jgi:hypothetical protein
MTTPQPLHKRMASRVRSSAASPVKDIARYNEVRDAFEEFASHAGFDGVKAWNNFAPFPYPLPARGMPLISDAKRAELLEWADLIEDNENLEAAGVVVGAATC